MYEDFHLNTIYSFNLFQIIWSWIIISWGLQHFIIEALSKYGFKTDRNHISANWDSAYFPCYLEICYDCSFGICTVMYAGAAVMGYMMFGESTLSQFTLNMPQDLVASQIAVWTTVLICSSWNTLYYRFSE